MFQSDDLKNHFENSSTIRVEPLILAEWNMNLADNIFRLGNYRYRPLATSGIDLNYKYINGIFDKNDFGNFYTDATDSDIVIDGGVDEENLPQKFVLPKQKMGLLFSLEDCVKPFRPRSGINKVLYLNNKFVANSGQSLASRPRYYMASKNDQFKYWTSFRNESINGINYERGIAKNVVSGAYYIDDAAPYVVYKERVPANRIVVKMQTNVGTVDLGPFSDLSQSINDPLFGNANKTTPVRWRIQYLDSSDNWIDAQVFTEASVRSDGTPIIKEDGYVELQYGIIPPEKYKESFVFVTKISSESQLPLESINGNAYLVVENEHEIGTLHIWDGILEQFDTFVPSYGWKLTEDNIINQSDFVTNLVSPDYYDGSGLNTKYREFEYVKGLRIVVDTMNKFDSTFDLIEFSPRLLVDMTDKTVDYNITKSLSDLSQSSLPVGQLLASTGSINLFDYDQAFNEENSNSIIANFISKNIKFSFYEKVINVNNFDYYIPIKTLYSEGIPQSGGNPIDISIDLRDFYFYLESLSAPDLFVTNISLSYAISMMLDYIGFSNYKFKRLETESDPIIPFFFVSSEQNIAEVLNQLATSTQSAMYFDEYNDFIVMTKDYLFPSETERNIDIELVGTNNQQQNGVYRNQDSGKLQNIESISSKDKKVFNDGEINYTARYIQRSYGSLRQASMVDSEKTWIYKPVLLWESSGSEFTKSINELPSQQSKYVLGAMPLNSNLTDQVPIVESNQIINNVFDLGENVYWLTRNQGYFYANGEIIKYDAVQYNITGTGNVWISSNQEYQKYFASLPFNGKIYPTGLVRIFVEPYYETVDGTTRLQNGDVFQHGRGQFGTEVANHYAGLNSHWSDNDNVRGCKMESKYLFSTASTITFDEGISPVVGPAGQDDSFTKPRESVRTGIIKNFLSSSNLTETEINYIKSTQYGTIQSSAFIFNGPVFSTAQNPLNSVAYVYKPLDNSYKHFGTRMRIVGRLENNRDRFQTAVGSTSYYQVPSTQPNLPPSIEGGSGGIGIMVNPETNNGYFFEMVALTQNNVESYMRNNDPTTPDTNVNIHNLLFYKVMRSSDGSSYSENAVPIKLWGGLAKILVDDGNFTGQYRMVGEENPTVYDLAIEYENIGGIRRFYLYVNNKIEAIVDDTNPLPEVNNMALFTRGSSRCMFENVYALNDNLAQNTSFTIGDNFSSLFGDNEINANEALRKYSMSGIVKSTYLSGLSSLEPPKYNMYFEEFGTIMRECAYFNIKYDQAFPALYAKLSPTFNRIKGYTTSGFYAGAYGAEFLIFNSTDTALSLDETTGNYLRIQGITFTQDTTYKLTVDDYFKKVGNLSDPIIDTENVVRSGLVEKQKYDEIKLSRMRYGKNSFSLDTPYIQTQDDADSLMGWVINKVMKPRKAVGVNIFAIPTIQLGDIVTIDYKDSQGVNLVTDSNVRFIVYNIEYSRSESGPTMVVYLNEI